ncbi:MAG: hypothetical protein ACREV5_16520 [Steroidobacter sp.]
MFKTFGKRKKGLVGVHMNRAAGVYYRWMEIGKDIPAAVVEKYSDPHTGDLYIFEMVIEGQLQKYVCKNKDAWAAVTARIEEQVRQISEEFLTGTPGDDRLSLVRQKFLVRLRSRRRFIKTAPTSESGAQSICDSRFSGSAP